MPDGDVWVASVSSVWTYISGAELVYLRLGGVQTVYSCVHQKDCLESLSQSVWDSPSSGFLSYHRYVNKCDEINQPISVDVMITKWKNTISHNMIMLPICDKLINEWIVY